jgi:XTP/dITP diphosphohydrolase
MKPLLTIAVAATSRGKLSELTTGLSGLPVRFVPHEELVTVAVSLRQDGDTLEHNAIHRARTVSANCHFLVLADESGLEVDSLAGRPGVRSAIYAHGMATDAENNAALLRDMNELPPGERSARFRCVLAVAGPALDSPIVAEGVCEGTIARSGAGVPGTGYEPLFLVEVAGGRSMAELSDDERKAHGHVARAVRALRPRLAAHLDVVVEQVERIVR